MIEFVFNFLFVFSIVLGIIFIHELGHYLTGRWVVGVPQTEIAIVMTEFPQHVALRADNEWVAPDEIERYSSLYEEYDPQNEHLKLYIGAGELFQAFGVVTIAAILVGIGLQGVATSLVIISVFTTGVYLVWDVAGSVYAGHPMGDYSAPWGISPPAAIAVLIGFLIPHVLIYVWI